jgi:hypothetical protein
MSCAAWTRDCGDAAALAESFGIITPIDPR